MFSDANPVPAPDRCHPPLATLKAEDVPQHLSREVMEDGHLAKRRRATTAYFAMTLEDGVPVQVAEHGGAFFLRVANRRIGDALPHSLSIRWFTMRIFKYFQDAPNAIIQWSEEARQACDGAPSQTRV